MLLTERVGLGIDYGFKLDPRRRSEVTILAEETRQEMINDFVDGRHGLKEVFRVYGVNPQFRPGDRNMWRTGCTAPGCQTVLRKV